jgi:sulfonate transport system substrate-binding protein
MTTRRVFLAASISAVALPKALRAAEAPKEFRIGYQKGGLFSVAKQQQTFEKRLKPLGVETVKWTEFQFGPPLMEALGLGAIDIGPVGDSPPVFAQAAGANVVYIAATAASQNALLVPANSPVKSVAELKGKKIAIAKGSSSHNLTVQLLKKAGVRYDEITPVYLTPADAAAAFARGSVDAWTIWDPYFAIAELRQKARVLATDGDVKPSHSFYLANRDFANRHPNVVQAVIEEIGKLTEWSAANRDQLAALISQVTGVDLAAQQRAVNRAIIELKRFTPEVIAQQQEIADTFFELGLIPRKIAIREAIWRAPGA